MFDREKPTRPLTKVAPEQAARAHNLLLTKYPRGLAPRGPYREIWTLEALDRLEMAICEALVAEYDRGYQQGRIDNKEQADDGRKNLL